MKYFLFIGFLFIVGLDAMDQLPAAMPEDITIRYYKPLGHAGRGFSMELTSTHCKYTDTSIQRENKFDFVLNPEELTTIYQTLVKNKIQKIEYSEDFLHDYDGLSLHISWGGQSIEVTQSGKMIKSNWAKEWKNITETFENIRAREWAKAVKEVEIFLDESLVGSFIYIQINSTAFTKRKYVDVDLLKENPIRVKMLPGVYSIFCILYKDYDLKKKKEIFFDPDPEQLSISEQKHDEYLKSLKSETFTLTLDSTTKKTFRVLMKKNALVLK